GTDTAGAMSRPCGIRPHSGRVLVAALGVVVALVFVGAVGAAPPLISRDLARVYFGPTFVRAEIVSVLGRSFHDFRVDEGRVVAVRPNAVDLLERDGTRETIRIGATTQIAGVG